MDDTTYSTIILGAGPGGTGPLVCAAQAGRLAAVLDRGVLLIDRRSMPSAATLGRYVLNADSQGTSFLECIDNANARRALGLDELPAETLALERHRSDHPALALVSRHLDYVGAALGRTLADHPTSAFLPHTTVQRIVLESEDTVGVATTNGRDRPQVHHARSVVLALGGRQARDDVLTTDVAAGLGLRALPARKLELTDRLLSSDGLSAAARRLAQVREPRVTILGGSHSAFSAAWALLYRMPDVFWQPGSIRILFRSAPRVFYPTLADAAADGHAAGTEDVCPKTQRVHRLGGLRGDGRTLWRAITGRPGTPAEDRVTLGAISAIDDLQAVLDASDLVVPAFGYRATTVPVLDASGQRVPLAADTGGALVDATCRVRRADGSSLERVFGIGMASGFQPAGELGGERSFVGQTNGVWLYQNGIGARVLEGIDAVDRRWSTSTGADRPGAS